MKLEDLVQTQNKKIDSLYDEYDLIMEEIESSSPNKENIKRLNNAGIKLFNYMDSCYASLDAASEDNNNEKQTQLDELAGLFSDAFESTIPYHYAMMRAFYGEDFNPSKHAFSGMQQLLIQVKNKKEIESLKAQCLEHNLPIKGFEKKRRFRMTKTNERILSIALAILSVISLAILIPNIKEPTTYIYNFYCVLISILGGYSAAAFTGTLGLSTDKIKARSGYAVFIVIFFILQGLRIFS